MTEVVLVCGPPCAGKTTYVREHAQLDDLVLDQDELGHSRYQRALTELRYHHGRAWVIRCLPTQQRREAFAEHIGATRTVLLQPSTEVLMQRARARPESARHVQAVRSWLEQERGVIPVSTATDPSPLVKPWW
ncbi:AAA family ATPase [Pseudonocardia sichuanensis]